MSDSSGRRRKTDAHLFFKIGVDGTQVPLSAGGTASKWRVGGWVGGLCVRIKDMDGKGTLKMFSRKKRELIKTNSISKKSRAGSPGPHTSASSLSVLQEQYRRDAGDSSLPTLLSSSSLMLTPNSAGLPDSTLSCPGTPKMNSGQAPAATMRRPTALSRHASAAGFPLQSWVMNKVQSRGATTPTSSSSSPEGPESTVIEVEDIPALLRDVQRFAEAVEKLKDVVLAEGKESRRPVAHECLGEVLRVLRQVINTYPLLNTVEILTAAGKLISKVKGFHYEASNDGDKQDFEKAIETIAVAFSSNVSELLMGEVDSSTLLSLLPTEKSRSMENLCVTAGEGGTFRSDLHELGRGEEVDVILQRSEGGVESALLYAKTISKYMKDLITYAEKRTSLEMEFSKGLQRLYQSCKHSITHPYMPLFSIYSLALEQDQEQSVGLQQANTTLHTQTFIQPLIQRKHEHEKRRKDIKEHWVRAKRKLMECEANLRKAKQTYMARCEEHEKAKCATTRAEEDGGGSTGKSLEKKKRLEEEARNKADEAEATYRTCIADATAQMMELEHTKVTVLRQLQDIIKQSDQTLRSATISYYQLMHMQTVALPVHYQTLCESSKLYDPGQQYAAHVRDLQLPDQPAVSYTFESYCPSSAVSPHNQRRRIDSVTLEQMNNSDRSSTHTPVEHRDTELQHKRQAHKSWGSTVSDDSVTGDAGLESPTASTADIRKMARTSSSGTVSSIEDADEKEGNVASFEATTNMNGMDPDVVVSTRPFRNVGLSKAARTHRLRKLRTPAKCRECDSYVYFQGAECEECFLPCHKRCLETLAIQCGHKKLQGRLQLFGQEFSQVASNASDGVPFIISKSISELDRRALKLKGLYRINGVKSRVEKLCQAFENGKELVDLSQYSPHDISNVVKLYLRQLPEPIMPFHLYNRLMGVAKESMQSGGVESGSSLVDRGPNTEPGILALVDKLKLLLTELPKANIMTLRYVFRHLIRIVELEEDNKMNPNSLGIVFGPSLMRPRPTGATISLSSLVDYPHQARIIEALIVFYSYIFQSKTSQQHKICRSTSVCVEQAETEDKRRSLADEEEGGRDQRSSNADKLNEGCGTSSGSCGSSEILSDSELEEGSHRMLMKQESLASVDNELSIRDSLDLSNQTAADSDLEDGAESQPALPQSGLPDDDDDDDEGCGDDDEGHHEDENLRVTLAELNINQSNNKHPRSPVSNLLGHPLSRLCGKILPLSRNREREPDYV